MNLKKQRLAYFIVVSAAFMTILSENYFVPRYVSLNRFLVFWFLFVIGTALCVRGILYYVDKRGKKS